MNYTLIKQEYSKKVINSLLFNLFIYSRWETEAAMTYRNLQEQVQRLRREVDQVVGYKREDDKVAVKREDAKQVEEGYKREGVQQVKLRSKSKNVRTAKNVENVAKHMNFYGENGTLIGLYKLIVYNY